MSPSYTADQLPTGTTFNVTIKVANFDPFNGWDVHVKVNSSIINPIALYDSSNIFENVTGSNPFELANCVNGVGKCIGANDGSGIVDSAISNLQNSGTAMGDGLLFTITYRVVRNGFSPITIFADTFSNTTQFGVQHTTLSGSYGTRPIQPDFDIGSTPTDLAMTLAFSHSVSKNATITITSVYNFSGPASVSAEASLQVSIYPDHIFLPRNGSNSSTLTISASNSTTSTKYFVNVTVIIGSISHWQVLPVRVNPIPDPQLGASPSLLKIHATNSGSSIITVSGNQSSFSGLVKLSLAVPQVSGLNATLGSYNLTVTPTEQATTVFNVRTPDSLYPFVYKINITISGQFPRHDPLLIRVVPPSPDFGLQISSSGYAIQAGKSRTFTLTMTSLDYFKGQLFLLATSLSGLEATFTRPSVSLEYGNSSTTMLTITVDPSLFPGNHNVTLIELGTTFQNVSTNHTITMTITVTPPPVTILGLQPPVYFGVVGALWIIVIGAAVLEIRKPKAKRFLS